ncbi:MAG: DUF3500 domain-containing protein [Bacteroidetes bacterium]|nr:DUF3500 domain-containing protein [Fibrella sp.]
MKTVLVLLVCCLTAFTAAAQTQTATGRQQRVKDDMQESVQAFLQTLTSEQRKLVTYPFADDERYNWHFVPRQRKGLPLKQMTPEQRTVAMALLKTGLSQSGYDKTTAIMAMENVLRVIEKRGDTDTHRDPDNYAFTVFGDPATDAQPWGWRVEGHHVSLNFSSMTGQVLSVSPMFLGSNPGEVRIDGPQKGKQILRQETELAFALLKTLTTEQRRKVIVAPVAYREIVTGNSRKAAMEKMEGIPLTDMTSEQRTLFLNLLQVYMSNYRVTLAKQQMGRVEKAGLDQLRFAWAGDQTPELGEGKGWYYRIHGPMLLIEYDNSQNDANHIHTIVRDLTNDFGEDVLKEHYAKQHK